MTATRPEATWPDDALDPHIAPHLERAALVVIDTQVDFADGGAATITGTSEVVPAIARLRTAFRAAHRPVVHVIRLYAGEDVDLVRRTAVRDGAGPVAPRSAGASVVPELRDAGVAEADPDRLLAGEIVEIAADEYVLWKPRWSAFHRTDLDDHLRRAGVDTVVVAGCNFPNCPRATIVDASERDYRVLVAADAISGVRELHLSELGLIGVLHADADGIVAAL